MKVEVKELRAISEILFSHLEGQDIEFVDIAKDYYWNVPQDQRYNPYEDPKQLNIGQLTDDWQELQKLLQPDRQPISYCFVWLAAILRAVGEDVPF